MRPDVCTDVEDLVDSAFDELECICNEGQGPHDGRIVGFYSSHSGRKCLEGWICESHFRYYVEQYRPSLVRTLERDSYLKCTDCGNVCFTADDFCKVVTL